MISLVAESGMPTEYWLYGTTDKEYVKTREDFKSLKLAIEQLIDLGMMTSAKDIFKEFKGTATEELLIAALKSDIEGIILKKEDLEGEE